ncbi:non-ribosomal peptide synthetase [uncultured Winogradskyella sp.]|uniref:non-ribosomal peptide synthetase n=1 Tax=uncultured Winogradskyella sp. TaxID=395353 RepID=UPI002632C0BB|nr:non-ribosomal peptide synthetase [uncultured Winogradskyella sp.]
MNESIDIIENNKAFNPFSGHEIERITHTIPSQTEIWLACKIGEDDANRAYNESFSLVLTGQLHKQALGDAIQELIQRHESLRATFSADGRFMTVFKTFSLEPHYSDISINLSNEKDRILKNYLLDEVNHVFDLVKGPLLKISLIKVAEEEHHLIVTAHHIIFDGWSAGILLEELGSLYSSKIDNSLLSLPRAESFISYTDNQFKYLQSDVYEATEQFWLKKFESSVPQLSLPTDFPRPALRTFKSGRLDFLLNKNLVSDLKKVGIKAGSSFVTTLMTAFEVFLYSQTDQQDLVIGLPTSGQSASGMTQLIGHCVNLLPLRSKIPVNTSFNTYLKERKSALFDAYEHQGLSFGQLLQKLVIARDPSRIPLVPVMFNIDVGKDDKVVFKGLNHRLKGNHKTYGAFEMFLNISGPTDELIIEWSYNSSLFKEETIKKMMVSFEEIIKKIISNPEIIISDLVKADITAYDKLNNTKVDYPQYALHELIAKKAQEYSNKQAIKFEDKEISFEQFNQQVNQLANQFHEIGVSSGDVIGVVLPRSIELVVTLVAIMQCGAAYLPLDPSYPQNRLEYMLEDSQASFIITSKATSLHLVTNADQLDLEELFSKLYEYTTKPLTLKVSNEALAYLLYTSGSTGKPKGVAITHKNLVNFLYSMLEKPGIGESDKLLSITTISFDISGLELYIPLLSGASLVLANDETAKDGRIILDVIKREGITMIQATPTTWQMMLDLGWKTPLPITALCGGEALPISLAKQLVTKVDALWNMYGPTETTIWSSVKQVLRDDKIVTIGKPIANTQFYILNDQKILMEPGKTGEIIIGGDGVSNGYLNRQDLTNEKFINNPFNSDIETKLYRTGDLGQLLPSGELLCLGRIDQQVKVRGHRIELEEIEESLDTLDGIQHALVVVKDDNLISFVISDTLNDLYKEQIDLWKEELTKQLPAHMIPHEFHLISEFPTTLNGKVDRKALLNNSRKQSQIADYTAPRTKTEQTVSEIWCKSLNKEKIDIHSDFFELGGHSIIAVKVIASVENIMGKKLPLSALMVHPTIEKLSTFIDGDIEKETWSSLVSIKTEGNKTPLYVVHGAGHNILFFNSTAKHLDNNQPVYGLQSKGLNKNDKPHDKIEEMASHYISEILQKNPEGPYALAGYSFGGIVAYEMARQLLAQGKKVETVVLIDTYVFPKYYFSDAFRRKCANVFYTIGKVYFAVKNMFSSVKNFKTRIDIFMTIARNLFLRVTKSNNNNRTISDTELLDLYELDRNQDIALNQYTITPDNVEIDLLVADDNVYFKHDAKNFGWKNIALGGITRHMIPGNHAKMFTSPNDEKLASILQNILDTNNNPL